MPFIPLKTNPKSHENSRHNSGEKFFFAITGESGKRVAARKRASIDRNFLKRTASPPPTRTLPKNNHPAG
jgi:hypothetical protein